MRKIKGKICKNKHIKLYHISEENHNNRVFKPRIPLSPLDEGENKTIARICFSTSLSGAFRALTFQDRGWSHEYYVHIPTDITKAVENSNVIKPSIDLVIDQEYTSEYWVREKVTLKCIGIAKFRYINFNSWFGPFRTKVKIKWVKKFE